MTFVRGVLLILASLAVGQLRKSFGQQMPPRQVPIKLLNPLLCAWIVGLSSVASLFAQIVVGPNILVSRDGDFPHVEYMIAANPVNQRNIVAIAMSNPDPAGTMGTRTYVSKDAGNTWKATSFEGIHVASGDPQVAFGPTGTAYSVVIAEGADEGGGSEGGRLHVFRSEDGGDTWLHPTILPFLDHPQMAVDRTSGQRRGRIYIWGLRVAGKDYALCLYRSEDDGRTFIGPMEAVHRQGGANTSPPIVLSDGTLALPYMEFDVNSETHTYAPTRSIKLMTSSDGGVSFSRPQFVGSQSIPAESGADYLKHRLSLDPTGRLGPSLGGNFDFPRSPEFAADSQGVRFPNRIYAVWGDCSSGNSRVLFAYSTDFGRNWTKPRQISPEVPTRAYQYLPKVAVNRDEVVGIEWLDSRNSAGQNSYELYFTASIDGGQSFLPARRVSSHPSFPAAAKNLSPGLVRLSRKANTITLQFDVAYVSAASVGDYIGLTSDENATFHALWADTGGSSAQVWTAQIRVPADAKMESLADKEAIQSTTDAISFILDPIHYDLERREAHLPVRIQNVSRHTIRGPLLIAVRAIGFEDSGMDAAGFPAPRILNSSNGKTGSGATFDYSEALGDGHELAPGEVSEAIVWLLKMDPPGQFQIEAELQ